MKKTLIEKIKTFLLISLTTVTVAIITIFAYSHISAKVGYKHKNLSWNIDSVEAASNLQMSLDTNFSKTEKIVGQWTDGRPVYQITLDGYNTRMSWVGNMAYTSCTISKPVDNVERVINARVYMSSSSNGFINWSQIGNVNIGSTTATSWTIYALEDYYLRGLTIQYIKTTD